MTAVRLAVSQYRVERLASVAAWEAKQQRLLDAAEGAELLLFPEYASLELTGTLSDAEAGDLAAALAAMRGFGADVVDFYAGEATRRVVTIVAPSIPWPLADGRVVNRVWVLRPGRAPAWIDKLTMTRFEAESWGIAAGACNRVFDTPVGRVGVLICYDSEFPLLARAQVEAGARLLLVPSCTDSEAGYQRVRVGCRARALEQQCVVAQSPLVGVAPWSPAIDVNVGRAAVYGPPDRGFPEDGVIAEASDTADWLSVDLDLDAVDAVRREGQVLNHRDWWRQQRPGLASARLG